ncbi:DNA repair protein complementing XP-C cells homolog isoform X1 [Neodiprion lecontei]|uniref:DNA repair protein complementing XP-C cells homolog isoform X1 n=1 Tax=Neodiprion lecontei TaxID=441921 RepID=A0A6J0C0T1_NEOLC|nr:DNA repair protein complementing XP-C cells homolog isoform X1 [Neodiprion lecontei]
MNADESDSESSDSSNEFMVAPDKLKSISPFFTKPTRKTASVPKKLESSEESDFDYENESHDNNDDLMAQVLKNLEATKKSQAIQSDQSSAEKPENTKPVKKELTNEIADLLLLGETGATASTAEQDQDEPDEEGPAEDSAPSNYSIPKEGVKITLVDSKLIFNQRKKKKQETLEDLLKKKLNQQLRSNQVLIHKVGLLCWMAHGFYVNKQINNPILLAAALKLAPKNCYPKGRVDLSYLEKITKWFQGVFTFPTGKPESGITTLNLLRRLKDKEIHNYQELVLLYVATLRALGLTCRLVISLQPPALKVTKEQLIAPESSKVKDTKVKKEPKKETATRSPKISQETKIPGQETEKGNISARLRKATEARRRAAEILKRKKSTNSDSAEDVKPPAKKLRSRTVAAAIPVDKKGKRNSDKVKNDKEVTEKGGRSLRSRAKTAVKHWPKDEDTDDDDDDDDEYKMDDDKEENEDGEEDTDDEPFEKTHRSKHKASASKQRSRSQNKNTVSKIKKQSNTGSRRSSTARKLISSDEDDEENNEKPKKVKNTRDMWAEVYVECEENWISVSVPDAKIHCIAELYKNATDPVLYVMALNSEGRIKDVTRRYCPHWLTVTRKQRIDEKWWLEAHTPWKEPETALTKAEDEMLKQKELEQPLPKTVSECKGHPLYVLPRHLLKFEAFYPPDVVPLGYVRGEPIYSRHCVHTLRSRETWIKSARVVKPGENCYKVVKARPKYDKLSGARLKDESLEVFGKWQTDPYVPPEAKDGIVPRNEYGNVDLFKQCMLPKGTVHIQLPALNRIARKLDIDCAPAVVGFNFGGHGALPAFDGFIVCEEFEDVLREAWEVEQAEADKRAREKYEKRVYGNWRKLIKAVFIRERLTAKYDFNADEEKEKSSTSNKQTNKRVKQTKVGGKKTKVDKKK